MSESSDRPRDERLPLLRAIVAIARADGEIADAERKRIDQLMTFMRVDDEVRAKVYAALEGAAPVPQLPDLQDLPAYDTRLYVFQQALAMTFADGKVTAGERRLLDQLATAMQLEANHLSTAWRRAEEMWGVTPEA